VILADRPVVTAAHAGPVRSAATVEMPNPHVVIWVETAQQLAALELTSAPTVQPGRPDGQNLEFVHRAGPRRLVLRVHERGVGETRSCGTGICAVAVAAASADGVGADGVPWQIEVPGGTCGVTWRTDGDLELTGPAVLVAELELDDGWLAAIGG
jgi:diaminopimelate epimerase